MIFSEWTASVRDHKLTLETTWSLKKDVIENKEFGAENFTKQVQDN